MYESSPRSREVANALFQIDRLTEQQTRAVLRHIAIDEAVMNEAQCFHVACLINGTLHEASREGVNVALTCGTSLDAASQWEKSFASHPGHVSATFRKTSSNKGTDDDQSTQQVVLFQPAQSPPPPTTDTPRNVKPSLSLPHDLRGLSIINQGQLTIHYHSYNDASPSASQPATMPLKRALEKTEDEEYSEALSSLMGCNISAQSRPYPPHTSKRQRSEETEVQLVEPEAQKPQKKAKQEAGEPPGEPDEKTTEKKGLVCKNCGKPFQRKQNKGSNQPCKYHPGIFKKYAKGVDPKGRKGAAWERLYDAWSCCKNGTGSAGCTQGKHERGRG